MLASQPLVGLAYGPAARALLAEDPGLLDFVEVPFEHLRHAPAAFDDLADVPVILHCASMSLAGFVEPDEETLTAIASWAERTSTPWIGEHLSFVQAHDPRALTDGVDADPIQLTYTIAPQLSDAVLERVGANLDRVRRRFHHQIIVENNPQYFDVPGSSYSQVDFIGQVVERFDVDLLLDVSHLAVSASNLGFSLEDALVNLPLERVVEIHLSGISRQGGTEWDDHASMAPPRVLGQLRRALERASPRAITLEYNWAPDHRLDAIVEQLELVRSIARTGSFRGS